MVTPDTTDRTDTLHRLRTICGHVDGIARMVEEGADCFALIQQVQAVQASLRKVSIMLLDNYLHTCVLAAAGDRDPVQRERALSEIRRALLQSIGQIN
jgi:DNA-binding FrmR family transcriptional regulator